MEANKFTVTFSIRHETKFGEEMYVLGSPLELGIATHGELLIRKLEERTCPAEMARGTRLVGRDRGFAE